MTFSVSRIIQVKKNASPIKKRVMQVFRDFFHLLAIKDTHIPENKQTYN